MGDGATNNATKARATPKVDASVAAPSSADAASMVDPATSAVVAAAASATAENADLSSPSAKGRADDAKKNGAATAESSAAALTALVVSGLGAPTLAAVVSAAPAAPTTTAAAATTPREPNELSGASAPSATSAVADSILAKGAAADPAGSTLRDILGGDSSLFVSSVESRTYLGVDSAASAATTAAVAAAADIVATQQRASGSSAPASDGPVTTGKRGGASGAPAHGVAADVAIGESVGAAASKSSSAKSGDSSTGGNSSGNAAPSPAAATAASATAATSDLAGGFSASVSLDQVPTVIAAAADELSAAAESASGSTVPGASTAQPVKELQINLAPAELGSLQVTMRLADGKLSIVVEVAKTSTLQAIAGDRDAIAARLGSGSTPLDSLVVQPMRADATAGANSNGDAQTGTQDNPSNGANRNSPAGGQSTSQRDSAADAWRRQSASARRSAGDLTV